MKKLISALSVLLLGFMYSGCTENSPTQVSEDQDRTAIEDGSFVPGDVSALGKGRVKCETWPDCPKEGDNSSGVEYIVKVVPRPGVADLESFCPGFASNKLSANWFTSDCFSGDGKLIDPEHSIPFNYKTTTGFEFLGNGSIFIDVRKMTYRFWLWETTNRSDVYETGVQSFNSADISTDGDGVVTLKIHDSVLMCQNKKKLKDCEGLVNFGNVVYTPKPI